MLDCTSITFERATAEDATALLDLKKRVAPPKIYEPRVKIEDAINEIEANTFYFIKHRGRIIGSASFRKQDDGSAYVGNVAVDPLYRRQGVARAAMNFLIGQLGHAARIELVTHPDNRHALRLYASLGFSAEAEIANCFGDGEPRVKLVRLQENGSGGCWRYARAVKGERRSAGVAHRRARREDFTLIGCLLMARPRGRPGRSDAGLEMRLDPALLQ